MKYLTSLAICQGQLDRWDVIWRKYSKASGDSICSRT